MHKSTPSLMEDILKASAWTVTAFRQLGKNLDYSVRSLKYIDDLIDGQSYDGQPKEDGLLADGLGGKIFSFGCYIGETMIKNIKGSEWIVDDNDPNGEVNVQVKLPSGGVIWPVQRVMKRFKYGAEESVYVYGKILIDEWRKR